jgi:hypothetical protein
MEKVEINIRLAGGKLEKKIKIDPTSINNPEIIKDRVFFTLDECKVSMDKKEYELITDPLFLYLQENYPITKEN